MSTKGQGRGAILDILFQKQQNQFLHLTFKLCGPMSGHTSCRLTQTLVKCFLFSFNAPTVRCHLLPFHFHSFSLQIDFTNWQHPRLPGFQGILTVTKMQIISMLLVASPNPDCRRRSCKPNRRRPAARHSPIARPRDVDASTGDCEP